jgi:hypothetical protein
VRASSWLHTQQQQQQQQQIGSSSSSMSPNRLPYRQAEQPATSHLQVCSSGTSAQCNLCSHLCSSPLCCGVTYVPRNSHASKPVPASNMRPLFSCCCCCCCCVASWFDACGVPACWPARDCVSAMICPRGLKLQGWQASACATRIFPAAPGLHAAHVAGEVHCEVDAPSALECCA